MLGQALRQQGLDEIGAHHATLGQAVQRICSQRLERRVSVYPCLAFLTEEQSIIKTIAKGAQISYDSAVENAKRHCGKTINLMLDVLGGDFAGVVDSLIRPGYPLRIDPYSYHVKQNPSMLDRKLSEAS